MSQPGGGSGSGNDPPGRARKTWPPPVGGGGPRPPTGAPPAPHGPHQGQPIFQPPPRHGSQAPHPQSPPQQQPPYPQQPQQPYSPPQPPYPQQPYAPPQQPQYPAPHQPNQPPYPPNQPPQPFQRQPPPPYQQPAPLPHQSYHPPQDPAAATMQGWQPNQDPAWVRANQQQPPPPGYVPHPPAGESAPLHAPPTAAGSVSLAVKRAFRLYIDPREVTDAERATLESSAPPITDPDVQGFLAWRRSVHLVVAIAILPLLIFHIINLSKSEGNPDALKWLLRLQLVVDLGFAALLWSQLGRWNQWRKQRRVLAIGWLAYFLMPFVLYLYPLRSGAEQMLAQQTSDPNVARASALLFGMVASVAAMIDLAPKAISLMPGLLRGSLTSKLLFPGASGPGWLVLLLAPIYALLMYVVLIVPYQLTGNVVFVPAMIGLIGAQIWLGRMGYQLARPERLAEALVLVRKVRGTYVVLNLIGLVFVTFGVADMLKQFDLPVWRGFQILLALVVNVLLLTLIATDQIVANLVRGQRLLGLPGTGEAQADFARDIAHFDEQPRG